MVYSASSLIAELKYHVSSTHFFLRQLGWAVFSFLVLLYCMRRRLPALEQSQSGVCVSWHRDAAAGRCLFHRRKPSVAESGSSFPATLRAGETCAGALFLSFFLCRRLDAVNERHTLGPIAVVVSVMALAVAIADFGTAVVLVAMTVAVMFVAGIERRYLIALWTARCATGVRVSSP